MIKGHSFHIPVMGIGFTIDTPLKVSQYGIDSVISLVDDILIEKMRKMYCEKYQIHYNAITEKISDYRAKRITSYLNLLNNLAEKAFNELKNITIEKMSEIKEYFNMLPDSSVLKQEFKTKIANFINIDELKNWINDKLIIGSIDVNIMTKLDKPNYDNSEQLDIKYNDGHAAIRGYAKSDLKSSVIFSAGMNPRLYSYMESFNDFYPDENGEFKKKIVIKVSDYRSALTQGKFLAKKGLWVSEYRIESGLNCGGHAFATDGYLLGPILSEFNKKREELIKVQFENFKNALISKDRVVPLEVPELKISAQGGVGTVEEHDFLINQYKLDSVGWGSPFLLVPEVTNVDHSTLIKLENATENATENDLYLSNISPLGVPFNNLRSNSKDLEKDSKIKKGKPGSPCPKKFIAINNEFTTKSICTASGKYQHLKLKQLRSKGLSDLEFKKEYDEIVAKSCICVGLGTSALLVNNLDTKVEGTGVSVCPGPNIAYFSKKMSLKELVDHIYGRKSTTIRKDRPNMFVKEINLYLDYLQKKVIDAKIMSTEKNKAYLSTFAKNLEDGINYYCDLFDSITDSLQNFKKGFSESRQNLLSLREKIDNISVVELSL
jgi:hypothetical protein